MNKHFFIPLSAYSFPELASAEAISPTVGDVSGVFIGRRRQTITSGGIPVNPCENLLILYSRPVSWKYKSACSMDYPLVVRVSDELVDADSLLPLTLPTLRQKGISAWAYPKTIFCRNVESVGYLFRSEEEKAQLLQSLSSYQEVKNIKAIRKVVGLWSSCGEVVVLPDDIQNEITWEVERKGRLSSLNQECLQDEIRTGACLGYDIAKIPTAKSAIELLKDIQEPSAKKKATKCLHLIKKSSRCLRDMDIENLIKSLLRDMQRIKSYIQMLQQDLQHKKNQLEEKQRKKLAKEQKRFKQQCALAAVATEQSDVDWCVDETVSGDGGLNGGRFKAYYRYVGRKVLEKWEGMVPILQKTVDFIAAYPPDKWNWVGNKERIAFVKELWNNVLYPSLCETKNEDAIGKMRNEVTYICNHLEAPNNHSLEIADIKSDLLQALCVVLECAGDMGTLRMGMDKVKRRDLCLALYGAFKGYAYFPRQLLPECVSPMEGVQPPSSESPVEPAVIRDAETNAQSSSVEPSSEIVVPQDVTETRSQSVSLEQRIVSAAESVIERFGKKKDLEKLREGVKSVLEEVKSTDYDVNDFLVRLKKESGWSSRTNVYKKLSEELTGIETEPSLFDGNKSQS